MASFFVMFTNKMTENDVPIWEKKAASNTEIDPPKGTKIKNQLYKDFLDGKFIQILGIDILQKALENIKGKHFKEGRALLIMLYFTGGRPSEILNLKSQDVLRQDKNVIVHIKTTKKGVPRSLVLPYSRALIKELWAYSQRIFPTFYLFEHFRSKYVRTVTYTSAKRKGQVLRRPDVSAKLRHHFIKWFGPVMDQPIPPYYLRHNLFSHMSSQGATDDDIKRFKGAKTMESVMPYIHFSIAKAKKMSRLLPK